MFDKASTTVKGPGITTTGVEWGIFVALGVAGLLAYAGYRLRGARRAEPPLPWEVHEGERIQGLHRLPFPAVRPRGRRYGALGLPRAATGMAEYADRITATRTRRSPKASS